jgi:hypothetical protein
VTQGPILLWWCVSRHRSSYEGGIVKSSSSTEGKWHEMKTQNWWGLRWTSGMGFLHCSYISLWERRNFKGKSWKRGCCKIFYWVSEDFQIVRPRSQGDSLINDNKNSTCEYMKLWWPITRPTNGGRLLLISPNPLTKKWMFQSFVLSTVGYWA